MMRMVLISLVLLSFLIIVSLAQVILPSDMITKIPAPSVLDLQHVDPNSAKAIDAQNPNLTDKQPTRMANYGSYYSDTAQPSAVQNDLAGVPKSTLNFSERNESVPLAGVKVDDGGQAFSLNGSGTAAPNRVYL
jgi:hypothetical protein